MKFFYKTLFIVLLAFVVFVPQKAYADEIFPETAPFEVSLLYHKMLGITPDFKKIAKTSPVYLSSPELGKEIILEEQISRLKVLFYALSEKTPITIIDNFSPQILKDASGNDIVKFLEVNDKFNYIYDIDDETYIVFVRNVDKINPLTILSNDQLRLFGKHIKSGHKVGVEIILSPVAADAKPFDYKGENMRLILADVSFIRFIDNSNGKVFLEIEPIKSEQKLSEMELFFNKVVKERRKSQW